jgi:hypothetical protein
MADREGRTFFTRIRGNAEWELVKWLWMAGKSALFSAAFWILQRLRHVHVDWMGIAILFLLCMIVVYLSFPKGDRLVSKSPAQPLAKPPQHSQDPQELRSNVISLLGGLYAFLLDHGEDPFRLREYEYAGMGEPEVQPPIKAAFAKQFKDQMIAVEEAANNLGLWKTISLSFYGVGRVSVLDRDVLNADDVRGRIDALRKLLEALDSKYKSRHL